MKKKTKTFDEQVLDWLTNKTNRSVNQTKFLLSIVNEDWRLLLELEEALSAFYVCYCPSDFASVLYWIAKYRLWKEMNWEFAYTVKKLL